LISDPGLSYHLSGRGLSISGGHEFERFTLELDVSADDYAGRINSIGGSGKAQLVRRDGVMRAPLAVISPRSERRIPTDSVIQFTPFLDIRDKDDLQADGSQKSGRQTLNRYVSTSQYRPDVAHMMDLSQFGETCDVLQLELLVTASAVPVSAHFECRVNDGQYSGTSDYKFTDVGKEFSIKPPT